MKAFTWPERLMIRFNRIKAPPVLAVLALSLFLSSCNKTDGVSEFVLKASSIITSNEAPCTNIDSLVTNEKSIFVSDIHHIKVFDRQGNYIRSIGEQGHAHGQFADEVIGLAINSRGELLAVDMQNQRVQAFNAAGDFIRAFGKKGSQDGQFLQPQGIVTDQFDLIYVTDKVRSDVQVFSPNGEFLYRFGRKGNGKSELLEPESMAIHGEKLYIADEGNHRIQVFTPRGVYLDSLPGFGVLISAQLESSMDDIPYQTGYDSLYDRTREGDIEGIAFDNNNRLYFVDEDQNTIKVIEQGSVIATFASVPGIKSADGIAFSADYSALYVADQGNNRVLVFKTTDIEDAIGKK